MKKLIAFAVVFALVAGAVFAQEEEGGKVSPGISISGSAGAKFVPFLLGGPKYDGKGAFDQISQVGPWDTTIVPFNWKKADSEGEIFTGLYGYGVSVNVTGKTDYAGFGIGFNQDGVTGGNFWVQPLGSPLLKFAFGGDNMAITSDDLVPGLGISLKLPLTSEANKDLGADNTFVNAWRQLQVGVGYTIADIGKISVGYTGGWAESMIDLNNLKDFQFTYLFGRDPPKNAQKNNPGVWGSTVAIPDGSADHDANQWNAWEDPDFDKIGMTTKSNPILYVEQLAYGNAKFTAGFNLTALKSIGLGVDLGADFVLPQAAKYESKGTGNVFSVERKNSGFANLTLGVTYGSGDFNLGFGFSAKNLGKSKTITYGETDMTVTVTGVNDDKDNWKTDVPNRAKGTTTTDEKVEMNISLNPSYKIDGTTIGATIGIDFTTESKKTTEGYDETPTLKNETTLGKNSTAQYKFGAFVKFKPFGNATLQVGIDVATPLLWTANGANSTDPANTQPIPQGNKDDGGKRFFISVPISFSVNF